MKLEIKIPTMGESISEANISSILKDNNSYVKQDEEILELETDKVNQVLYAPASGSITLTVSVGTTVKIGQVIGFIDTEGKKPGSVDLASDKKENVVAGPCSGSARQMTEDFVASLHVPSPSDSSTTASLPLSNRRKMSSLRKTIAQKLVEVKNETAMLTTFNEVDMTRILEIRASEKERFQANHGVKLGFMSFFIKACVLALKEFPDVGAFIDRDEIVGFEHCHIGVAVSTEKGLLVPVIKNCDNLSYAEIEKELELLSKKAREGEISFDALKGGIFTITNGGVFGSLLSTPILNPPQSAILGMHAIVKRPVAINDQVAICPMMYLALSYDHRIIDGKEAVQFLVKIKEALENPAYEI